jgi:uncharacterized protein (TIGR00288 family)
METGDELRLAVLIDADNAPRKRLKSIMEEIAIYGVPTIKRIYGDWTTPNLAGWKNSLLEHAITPIQQYGYTTGKNSTDSAMIIDAMDILYSGNVDGFCLVSSDSDFTRLATRLRESGKKVIGIGEKKTPSSFIAACNKFIYTEIIGAPEAKPAEEPEEAAGPAGVPAEAPQEQTPEDRRRKTPNSKPAKGKVPPEIISLISTTISDLADDEGWAFLGEVGTLLIKKQPDFDPRNFGFEKLTPLIKSVDSFDIDIRQTNFPHIKHIYIKNRG